MQCNPSEILQRNCDDCGEDYSNIRSFHLVLKIYLKFVSYSYFLLLDKYHEEIYLYVLQKSEQSISFPLEQIGFSFSFTHPGIKSKRKTTFSRVIIMSEPSGRSAMNHNDDQSESTTNRNSSSTNSNYHKVSIHNNRITSPLLMQCQQTSETTMANNQAYDEIHDVQSKHSHVKKLVLRR